MHNEQLTALCHTYLDMLCYGCRDRSVGSEGNRTATHFFDDELRSLGWHTAISELAAMDWEDGGATLAVGRDTYTVFVSPYSLGCSVTAELTAAGSIDELEELDATHNIVLLHSALAREQLMPKSFVFYNPEEHRKIISLLENSGAKALICATGRNAALAGGVYPFPLIEDGDFDVPSVYMTEEEGTRLLNAVGRSVTLNSKSRRIYSEAYNVVGSKGNDPHRRIVITAHIDAKKGTPGAIDNATGVAVLLLLARLLKDYNGDTHIELVAFNGEDYFSVPGQMKYIEENQGRFNTIRLNINIDGAGYHDGTSAFSFFELPSDIRDTAQRVLSRYPGITEGIQWAQGDHSIFLQFGVPALAVSSQWFIEHIDEQRITHTPDDNPEIVDCGKVADISEAIAEILIELTAVG